MRKNSETVSTKKNRVTISAKVDTDLIDWIKEQAQKVKRTPSNFIEQVLIIYRKNAERKAKND